MADLEICNGDVDVFAICCLVVIRRGAGEVDEFLSCESRGS